MVQAETGASGSIDLRHSVRLYIEPERVEQAQRTHTHRSIAPQTAPTPADMGVVQPPPPLLMHHPGVLRSSESTPTLPTLNSSRPTTLTRAILPSAIHTTLSPMRTLLSPIHSELLLERTPRARISDDGGLAASFSSSVDSLFAPAPRKTSPSSGSRQYLLFAESLRDVRLTVTAVLYATVCLYVTAISNSIADRINPNNLVPVAQRLPLPDPFMFMTRPLYQSLGLPPAFSDYMILVCVALIMARVLTMGQRAFTTMRRIAFVTGTVYFLRAMTVVATVLPNPLLECESQWHDNIPYDAFLIFTLQRTSCGDVFFSGHTIIFTIALCVWTTYSRSSVMKSVATVAGIVGMLSLIMSSYHYTIDVAVGWAVTSYVWTMYHYAVTLPSFRRKWWGKTLYRLDNAGYFTREEEEEDTLGNMFDLGGYFEVVEVSDE